jgi:peptidase M28-like protein
MGDGRTSRRAVLGAAGVAAGAVVIGPGSPAAASESTRTSGPGAPVRAQRPDRELREILRQVDHRRIEATIRRLVSFGTRHTLSVQDDPVRGVGAARDWLFARFQEIAATSGGRMTVELQSFIQPVANRVPVPTRISNVVATLRGDTDPGRMYVISAHYDSRVTDVMNSTADAPGADDDGSGVATVLELARLFATRRTAATIVFTTVAGEEQGLYGSAFQAQQFKAAGATIHGMFSNDIVGSSTAEDGSRDRRTLRLFADGVPITETPAEATVRQTTGGENDARTRQLARFARSVAENPETGMRLRLINRRDRYLRGSDHLSYLQQGYPGLRFTEPAEDFAHQHQDVRVQDGKQFGDLPQFCDFDYIAGVARVNAAVLWSLAQAPESPVNARIDTTQLTNSTTLTWRPSTAPDIAGYEVVWRETTAPDWTNVIPVGNVTTATIDLSKDNVFFGVRSVGASGHRSPVSFPLPT